MAKECTVTDNELAQLVALVELNHDFERWKKANSGFAIGATAGLASVYKNKIKPVLEPLRAKSSVVDKLMTERDADFVGDSRHAASHSV